MTAEFTIHTEPQGKGRPRFARVGTGVRTYTPEKTTNYEELIRQEYFAQCKGTYFHKMPVCIAITAYYKRPKRCIREWPTVKPDLDNIGKAVCDALNRVAYDDDAQIVVMTIEKAYSDEPRVEVTIGVFSLRQKQE